MIKKIIIGIIVILIAGIAWWYFSRPKAQVAETLPSGPTIEVKNFKYSPETLTVKPGEKITVIDRDSTGHSITADDGSFDSGVLEQGVPGTITAPTKPGTYAFHCVPHPSIKGTLVVE